MVSVDLCGLNPLVMICFFFSSYHHGFTEQGVGKRYAPYTIVQIILPPSTHNRQ